MDVLRCAASSCDYFPQDREPPLDCGQTVLVWGDHFGAADAAEKLAAEGRKVYVVTENREFAQWMEPCHRDVLMKRFAGGNAEGLTGKTFEKPVTVIPGTTVVEIKAGGELTLMDGGFRKTTLQVDNVVLASVEPGESVYEQLVEAGVAAVRIGDLKKVRNVLSAVKEGADAALALDEGFTLNANRALISKHPTEMTMASGANIDAASSALVRTLGRASN